MGKPTMLKVKSRSMIESSIWHFDELTIEIEKNFLRKESNRSNWNLAKKKRRFDKFRIVSFDKTKSYSMKVSLGKSSRKAKRFSYWGKHLALFFDQSFFIVTFWLIDCFLSRYEWRKWNRKKNWDEFQFLQSFDHRFERTRSNDGIFTHFETNRHGFDSNRSKFQTFGRFELKFCDEEKENENETIFLIFSWIRWFNFVVNVSFDRSNSIEWWIIVVQRFSSRYFVWRYSRWKNWKRRSKIWSCKRNFHRDKSLRYGCKKVSLIHRKFNINH